MEHTTVGGVLHKLRCHGPTMKAARVWLAARCALQLPSLFHGHAAFARCFPTTRCRVLQRCGGLGLYAILRHEACLLRRGLRALAALSGNTVANRIAVGCGAAVAAPACSLLPCVLRQPPAQRHPHLLLGGGALREARTVAHCLLSERLRGLQ